MPKKTAVKKKTAAKKPRRHPLDRIELVFKRSINSPHHLRRLGRRPSKAEREQLEAGRVPQRRFAAGITLTMTREDLARYCLKEQRDYRVKRVRRHVPPTTKPPSSQETSDDQPPQPTGQGPSAQPPASEQATGGEGAEAGPGDGPGHETSADQ